MALAVPRGVVKMIVGHHTLHEVERRVPDHHVGLANVPTAPHGVRVRTFTVIGQLLEIVLRHTSYLPARRHDTERDTCNFTPSTITENEKKNAPSCILHHTTRSNVPFSQPAICASFSMEPPRYRAAFHARRACWSSGARWCVTALPPFGLPKMHRRSVFGLSALVALTMLAGCGDSTSTTATTTPPPYQLEVSNVANSFAYQASPLKSVSGLTQYSWRNDGTIANVNQSPSNLTGTASLVVLDAAGTQVYSRSLTDNGTFVTSAGTAGMWTVRINFSNVSGAVNFRLQRP